MTVAETTLRQLGGSSRIKVMTNARNFMSDDQGQTLVIVFPRNVTLRVRLDASDTYSCWTTQVTRRGGDFKVKTSEVVSDVYADALISVCEKLTGLAFRL